MTKQVLIAGFGGQGILFSGKFLAYDCWLFSQKDVELPNQGDREDSSLTCSI